MDLTNHFYSQPSKLSAYPLYQKRQYQRGGFLFGFGSSMDPNSYIRKRRKRYEAMGKSFLNALAGFGTGYYTYKKAQKMK